MFLITNTTTGETLGRAETIDEVWDILSKEVEEANAKKRPFEWNIYDTEERKNLI